MTQPNLSQILKPAQHLDLVFSVKEEELYLDTRGTIIYDVFPEEESVLIAQTRLPILRSAIGETIEATFLWRPTPSTEPSRYAFHTIIKDIINDYILSQGQQVQAIRLTYPKHLYERNIRFSYRIQPIEDYPIILEIDGYKDSFPLIDISEGGLCFSYSKSSHTISLRPGEQLLCTLDFNQEKTLKIKAEVVREFQKDHSSDIFFTGVKFLDLPIKDSRFLSTTIRTIERILLRKRSGLE
ncbi:MAG: PilZ domain-containing protein [Thermodesulfobacteriota bacterium]|nr:PilZ domain-containing protein [Thermodesulfobacteriota bacterium]